ncbi:hypothetical protein ACQR0Z_21370 [Bradyrhizobium sp. HKCCYLS3077]|uniref:hypothetical protein n=1 Tax=Bradyrhizobium sp. HKCCYLS3077 TaxID=3420761 RepID=UPI003EBF998C
MLMIFCLLCGAVLGTRYNVFSLIPTILAFGIGRLALDLFQAASVSTMAWQFVGVAASLQIGYLVGSVLQIALAGGPAAAVSGRGFSQNRHAKIS